MGDIGRTYRKLLPQSTPLSSGAGGQLRPDSGGNNGACKECQRRRIRCTGAPCMECQAHNRKCTFDELADKRRKANARQAQENLESERAYLDSLLDILRDDNIHTEVRRAIAALRPRPSEFLQSGDPSDPHYYGNGHGNNNDPSGGMGYFFNPL
ncbi:uncharacterized protein N7458_006127 [Penicillium daleae]|uniref:Zn(2)-C6 fungal-type domain-containing protein n=1 Tax=Penicillium daleae TaxID=63821 RepID=A0AAD6C6H4_9EURO|nr:uncharacterized protein N7458_006127 [Penicillium daleae]KAJ5449678.1 hypothetical protein N7458_006127 [Penicillium daleae]